jgi:hypothetical protein
MGRVAAAPMTAIVGSFIVDHRTGILDLWFKARAGNAIVSAVEVERTGS